jgi:hypothetical protein
MGDTGIPVDSRLRWVAWVVSDRAAMLALREMGRLVTASERARQ